MNDKKRIGLYFGSFNPIHEGHIFVVQKALENGIDKLYEFLKASLTELKRRK